MDNELAAIQAQRNCWIETINAGNADAFVAILTDDVVWLPPGQKALMGKDSVREWLAEPFASMDYNYSVTDAHVRLIGNWAVEEAHFSSQIKSNTGELLPAHEGQYLLIWHKKASGDWLIERYVDRSVA